ncbi:DNA polymerase alpha/epsilon subunit B-domain-containing protein [Cyathus striatus]|nr:DNA polymerase alpha/epsilon subunit B-domain-containing protein [Cyathus striatus]
MAAIQKFPKTSENLIRPTTVPLPLSANTPSFLISKENRTYKHQYSNIYFIRLRYLRPYCWRVLAGNPTLVPRVLEVMKSKLCYIIGTVYMDMPLKPNVMEDLARDFSIPPPPPPDKYNSLDDNIMLEDESGRIRLVGDKVLDAKLVTGVIIGALGMETPNGDFEVVDICYPGMPPQSAVSLGSEDGDQMDVDNAPDEWIAIVSGLDIGSSSTSDAQIQMLVEYLAGEGGGMDEQTSASRISRLIIAGNSLASISVTGHGEPIMHGEDRKSRRQAQDTSTFSIHPTLNLSAHLLDIARVMPIHILPGDSDPAATILPQQPLPKAMFGEASKFPTFFCETNPTYLNIAPAAISDENLEPNLSMRRTILVNAGQPLNDMFKYLVTPPSTRLSILESTLKWRHMAPTAPDTLWCHPYFVADPFIISETPHLYIVGGQDSFGTKMVTTPSNATSPEIKCRLVMIPSFSNTGILVLVNFRTLSVRCVKFAVDGMGTAGRKTSEGSQYNKVPTSLPVEP